MENKMQDSKSWRKDWKYLKEKLPLTTQWVTDGLDDWRTDKEVTEELMDFIATEISKARGEGFKEGERSMYYEISGYFSQTEGEHILERGKEYVIISREEYDKLSKLKDNK